MVLPQSVPQLPAPHAVGVHQKSGYVQPPPGHAVPSQALAVKPMSHVHTPAAQVECAGQNVEPHAVVKFEGPHCAPQTPQSSGQLAQLSIIGASHVPSPQLAGGVGHVAQVVCTPKIQSCQMSPDAGTGSSVPPPDVAT